MSKIEFLNNEFFFWLTSVDINATISELSSEKQHIAKIKLLNGTIHYLRGFLMMKKIIKNKRRHRQKIPNMAP